MILANNLMIDYTELHIEQAVVLVISLVLFLASLLILVIAFSQARVLYTIKKEIEEKLYYEEMVVKKETEKRKTAGTMKDEQSQFGNTSKPLLNGKIAEDKHFWERIQRVKESIACIQNVQFVGGRNVLEKIDETVEGIGLILTDEKFNNVLKSTPSVIPQAINSLDSRLIDCEKACELIANAVVLQECGNGREIAGAVEEAEKILSKQNADITLPYNTVDTN